MHCWIMNCELTRPLSLKEPLCTGNLLLVHKIFIARPQDVRCKTKIWDTLTLHKQPVLAEVLSSL